MPIPTLVVAVALCCATAPVLLQAQTGQQLFASNCAGCHGLDGKGGEHAPDIAASVEAKSLSNARLTQIVHDGVPASGMPAFRSLLQPGRIDAVVSYVRSLQSKQNSLSSTGDAEKGRTLFRRAQCIECHGTDGQGGQIGADLSGYGRLHSADELRQQILAHNRDRRRGITRVVTRQGKVYAGIIRNEDNFSLQLETLAGDFLFVAKPDLRTVETKPPAGLASGNNALLAPQDLDNMMTYLLQTPED